MNEQLLNISEKALRAKALYRRAKHVKHVLITSLRWGQSKRHEAGGQTRRSALFSTV